MIPGIAQVVARVEKPPRPVANEETIDGSKLVPSETSSRKASQSLRFSENVTVLPEFQEGSPRKSSQRLHFSENLTGDDVDNSAAASAPTPRSLDPDVRDWQNSSVDANLTSAEAALRDSSGDGGEEMAEDNVDDFEEDEEIVEMEVELARVGLSPVHPCG